MNTQPNTFYSLLDIQEYIKMKLDEGYKTYLEMFVINKIEIENTEDIIEEFLMEYTNSDSSIYLYDFTTIVPVCIFECLTFIRDEYMDMTGEEMDMIYSKERLEGQLIYFVGQEWGREQMEHKKEI